MADLLQRSLGPMVRVAAQFPLDLPPALADAHQLELAVLNLAVNARDAMPNGGRIDVSASSEQLGHPNAFGLPAGRYIRLSLADEGLGMDEATLARATEPFFTTKGVGKGTGLGLSMVHGLAAQSGGHLAIRSCVGAGTQIDLYLPSTIRPRAAVRAPDEALIRDDAVAPLRILVVDDDPLVLANTAALLEDLGHSVRLAASGPEALGQLDSDPHVDLLVTDQMMPGMTGSQLARAVQRSLPELQVLIVSGYAELEESEAGRFPLLAKPFTRQALARTLSELEAKGRVLPFRRVSLGQ
jgi:CheY-like chemotaxis protein